ncbi:sugar ABC transporter permease [candidate division KSB1 bacterium]|nr:sugar ABC transporter permease [candidate division KSB1 bacterium]
MQKPAQYLHQSAHFGLRDVAIMRLFIIPTILLLIVMNVFPLFWSLILSFTKYSAISGDASFIGLKNYRYILNNPTIWKYFVLTAKFVIISVSAEMIIGFGIALLLNRDFKLKGLVTTLFLIPMMMSPVIVGLFWKLIFNPNYGIFNSVISIFYDVGKTAWLSDSTLAFFAIVIVDVWMWSPYVMLLSLAGLSAIPKHLYESAEIDRASAWFKFWKITLPLVAPLLLIAAIFRTMEAFKLFDLVMGLTGGGPGDTTELISINLYRMAFSQWKTGQACAFAYIILIMIIAISNIYIKYLNKAKGD